MNEFLKQFLIESREFVEQATAGLLTLEGLPENAELLDAVFRAFHTLKGGAGIVEFPAMERAVHAAENILSDARSGRHLLNAARIGNCLRCLDQVVEWLDTIERTGELPKDAEAAADIVVGRTVVTAGVVPAIATPTRAAEQEWVTDLRRRHALLPSAPTAAVRFVPDFDCFYQGEDPVARMSALPELLAMDLEPITAWPALNAMDVYRCNLVLTALSRAAIPELRRHMKGCSGECEVVSIAAEQGADQYAALPVHAREVLVEQVELLRATGSRNFIGRVTAAGLTAANVLRYCGRADQARLLAAIAEQCLTEKTSQPMQEAIGRALEGPRIIAPDAPDAPAAARRAEPGTRTLRINAEQIDALVRLTGELTVAKNAMGHLAKMAREQGNILAAELKSRHGSLEQLTRELQTAVLGMRVLPLRTVLQRFPRLVREMSLALGKPLRLEIEGEDTEADKAIVEMLFEPLLHVVRNAADHGVENPEQRAAAGKAATATLSIRAARQGDQVLIEIRDDGGGVDVERVRQVARERGVASEETLRTMSDVDIVQLIFAPGFSTAAKLTALSGRGVGMDAVRTAVERMGGGVSVDSQSGRGTAVRILLPFSVMMTRVLTVEAGTQIFGIPLDAVVETVRVPQTALADLGAAQALVLRERTVPIVELAGELGLGHPTREAPEATVVITAASGQWVGIRVDRIAEQIEVILQPLEGLLSGTPGVAGTTLLGDGRVLLVLDIGALLQ